METVQGYIDHFIYRNEINGYGVAELQTEDEELICVGFFQGIDQGENVKITGQYVEHAVYGLQLKAEKITVIAPEDAYAMERYLAGGAIKGIGASLAKRIVKKFGSDTFRIMEEEPERLAEIKGISERKAMEIGGLMENRKELRDAMVFLQKYGITNNLALKVYDAYGMRLYSVIQENPYQLAEEIDGIGFKRADEIAKKAGIRIDSQFRINSGICYTLSQALAEGHTFLPREELVRRAVLLLDVAAEQVEEALPNLAMEKKIVIKQEEGMVCCYPARIYYEELACARMLHDLNNICNQGELNPEEERRLQNQIENVERELAVELDELQHLAVVEAAKNGIFILSGGPGTGKTTTINAIIRYFEKEGMDILLAAPTGRAAKRMTEATGFEAKTIHRLLELNGAFAEDNKRAHFEKNESNPLETDVLIIDEMSMVDIHLFYALLRALPLETRLILVGDVNQLPSVGPGQVLRDLIESQKFPLVMLRKIFRQASKSDIVVNAHKINRGEEIPLTNKSEDFFFLKRNNADVIYKHMILLITEKLPRYVKASPRQIQVLTPMRKGNLGVEVLNEILQRYLNPPSKDKKEHVCGAAVFREGDKVMQIKNNYQLEWEIVNRYNLPVDKGTGIFNGDMGIIVSINEFAQALTVEYEDNKCVQYHFSQLDELELAYAVTIHKSQGSEYPAVIMPLLSGPRQLLNRNLLYTGITRAKKCVTLIGSEETIKEMISNGNAGKRYTGLLMRIREAAGGI
ncbi:MAG: ATP-dependent RecD-like DNA helicase [Lachnospiraceae bacterium]|nr:ATP-dependent RecD-like DNA helicase [Lachnospiraceae bacterium]